MTACANSEPPTSETALYTEETTNSSYNTNSYDINNIVFADPDIEPNTASDINYGLGSEETIYNVDAEISNAFDLIDWDSV